MPTPLSLQLDIEGDRKLEQAISRLKEGFRDFRRVWPQVASVFHQSVRRQFDSLGAQSGGWRPLTESYAQWKAVEYPGQPVMRRTGALFQSLVEPFDANAVFLMRPTEFIRGSRLPYARYAHKQRPAIAMTDDDRREMTQVARESFEDFTKLLGFEVI